MTLCQNKFDIIFVPQGSEYRAVCRVIRKQNSDISIVSIPMGYRASSLYFQQWLQSSNFMAKPPRQVILMGLAGSLSPQYRVGQIVLYQQCGKLENNQVTWRDCNYLPVLEKANLVKGWTSDRIICSTIEKQHLYQTYGVEVVDMEGFSILEALQPMGINVAILRVISDDAQHNLPNLEGTISLDGQLQPIPLAVKMLQQPIASLKLIQGSLVGLKVLEQVAREIC
ncbi:phosphorylase [Aphanothece hegewaldii CCALA 016]|uniref:Phosphorylase n=1 Tax=Aphanothece hegewaldii CCALA 016 TaxID=2107694 RepID=A0A2T1LVL6_9CHRO|nr:phosphorylase [Aphanothece hegewaldii]PSF35684.1 phosphorylase [Aphanothece hegewaldii CCALA 016]